VTDIRTIDVTLLHHMTTSYLGNKLHTLIIDASTVLCKNSNKKCFNL